MWKSKGEPMTLEEHKREILETVNNLFDQIVRLQNSGEVDEFNASTIAHGCDFFREDLIEYFEEIEKEKEKG